MKQVSDGDNLMIAPDTELAARIFSELRAAGFDGSGITRDAYGPGENKAHDIVRAHAQSLGMEVKSDYAGNLHMTLAGRDRNTKHILLGSHLDTVAGGGNYDGAAGVVAGLAVAAGLLKSGVVLGRDLTVIAVRAEESGSWFPVGYPGSKAALGTLDPSLLKERRKDTGRTLEQHMHECGFDPGAIQAGRRLLSPDNIVAYLELHIEQGPVLDSEQIPVGVVTAIPSSRRYRAGRVVGQYNHSGATPRKYRADAAAALAELVYRVDQRWEQLDAEGIQLVCTFCTMGTANEASLTKIAGESHFQLDVRSTDPAAVNTIFEYIESIVPDIEARRKVRFELGGEGVSTGVPMDSDLRSGLIRAAERTGIPYRVMASGGGHDSVAFSQAGIPAAMLFIRNQNGSHSSREAMRMEDFADACTVVIDWLTHDAAI